MNQHQAPHGMVATLGHPANRRLIVKTSEDLWRYVDTGKPVDDEDFRAGWDDYVPEASPEAPGTWGTVSEMLDPFDIRVHRHSSPEGSQVRGVVYLGGHPIFHGPFIADGQGAAARAGDYCQGQFVGRLAEILDAK